MYKLIMIGPFPLPVHGMSLANQFIKERLSRNSSFEVQAYDTNLERQIKPKERQGRFEFFYLIKSLTNLTSTLFFLLKNPGSIAYFTPGQSILGLIRYAPAIILSLLINKKTILHIHGSRLAENIRRAPWFFRKCSKLFLKKVSVVIALSPSIAEYYRNSLGLENVYVCMNGVNIPKLTSTQIEGKYFNKPLKCLFLSNLMVEKGILELLDAVSFLNKNGYEIHLDLAGEIEPTASGTINKYIQDNPEIFTYHGVVHGEKKASLLRSNSIFCLPSYDEGIPLAILEAYAYGCTVITTDVGGIPDIFQEPLNGYICKPRDVKSLIKALETVYSQSENLLKIGENNAAEAQEKYSLECFEENLIRILTAN